MQFVSAVEKYGSLDHTSGRTGSEESYSRGAHRGIGIGDGIEPYTDELRRYHDRSMIAQAKLYCMGILKGIYLFEKDSTSEYKDWAVDAPEDFFSRILKDWKEACRNKNNLKQMDHFIEQECPEWV